jgi:hypothetical protein
MALLLLKGLNAFSLTETSFSGLRSLTFLDLTNSSLSEMPLTVFENTSIAELRYSPFLKYFSHTRCIIPTTNCNTWM